MKNNFSFDVVVIGGGHAGCEAAAAPDCRSEGISKDAPESYVWWPTRNFLTPDAEAIDPPGWRAAHVGAGFAVAAPRLLE